MGNRRPSAAIVVFGVAAATLAGIALLAAGAGEDSPAPRLEQPGTIPATIQARASGRPTSPGGQAYERPPVKVPSAAAARAAAAYAGDREGTVSFAVVNSEGKLLGREATQLFSAASTVKAMLLAAELERLERERAPLDAATDSLLRAMITVSDNDAADAIYARVGDPGMFAIARRAGMAGFTEAGHWGNAQVSAADLARFYSRLDPLMAGPHREYALGLLGSVAPEQSWGIPVAARPQWAVRFKGGWLPERALVHQAAELRDGDTRLSIAVLTDVQPSFDYGMETVRGITARLLSASGGG